MKNNKNLYIAFIKTNARSGAIIRKITKWNYSHISISLDEKLERYYAFSKLNYKSSFYAGFTEEYKSNYSELKDKPFEITYYKIPIDNEEYNKIIEFIDIISNDKEYIFNYPSMFTLKLFKGFEIYKSYNCITFVTKILTFIKSINLKKKYYKYELDEIENEIKDYYYKKESLIVTKKETNNSYYKEIPYLKRKKYELQLIRECFHRLIFKKVSNLYKRKNKEYWKNKTIKTFNEKAASYDKGLYGFNPRKNYTDMINRIHLENERLLDIGCGTGEILNKLKEKYPNSKLYGLDICEEMIKVAKSKTNGKKINYICADVEKMPFKNNMFDIVISSESFHHYPSPDIALKELYRVLKPNGKLILCDMYRPFPVRQIMNFMFNYISTGDIRIYTKKEIYKLLDEGNFKILNYSRRYTSYILEAKKK